MNKHNYTRKALLDRFYAASQNFAAISLTLLLLFLVLRIAELVYNGILHEFPQPVIPSLFTAWVNDLGLWLKYLFFFWLLHYLIGWFSPRLAQNAIIFIFSALALIQIALIKYFSEALIPLGSDLLGYSKEEITQTLGSAGAFSIPSLAFLIIAAIAVVTLLGRIHTKLRPSRVTACALPILSLLFLLTGFSSSIYTSKFKSDFTNNLVLNKSDFFYTEIFRHYFSNEHETDIYEDGYLGVYNDPTGQPQKNFTYPDRGKFPFLHEETTENVLAPFFNKSSKRPNIVIILVEGLGRAFSNEGAYLGSFTPFLDSLSERSIYFPNFLSAGGRTFAALPSILGSLPFAQNGFLELGNKAPKHLSLLSILKNAGYHTSFYYGGDSRFDKMDLFLKKNHLDELNDISSFPSGYIKLPAQNGFSWGYTDKDLYRWYLTSRNQRATSPQLSILLTVASHSPFLLTEQSRYFNLLDKHLQQLGFDDQKTKNYQTYKYQYASILYTDDALRGFFNDYKNREDFNNTIFLITGDHRMPEIPMSNKIDRYHVPLIIFSPLLKKTARIESVSTHFDIAPSLLKLLNNDYQVKSPSLSTWLGSGLDTNRSFRNIHSTPLMQTKTTLNDFVVGNYHLNNQSVYKISNNMEEDIVQDKEILKRLIIQFNEFKSRNNKISTTHSLIPDSIYRVYYPNNH